MTMNTEEKEMLRLKELGKIDGTIGAKKVGMILDMHNANVDFLREKHYNNDVHDRNLYYYKLWQRAIEEIRSGAIQTPKKEQECKVYLPPNTQAGKGLFMANGKRYVGNAE